MGFVPTMGAFHAGHRSLMRRSRDERDVTVVSIFVNPLQFGDARDLETYPRDEQADLAVAEREGRPGVRAVGRARCTRTASRVTVDPGPLGERLEGRVAARPLPRVATVVAKLFDAVGPCSAYFGEKGRAAARGDPQDGRSTCRCRSRSGAVPSCANPTGSPLSSRNRLAVARQREAATCLFLALSRRPSSRAPANDAGRARGRDAERSVRRPRRASTTWPSWTRTRSRRCRRSTAGLGRSSPPASAGCG